MLEEPLSCVQFAAKMNHEEKETGAGAGWRTTPPTSPPWQEKAEAAADSSWNAAPLAAVGKENSSLFFGSWRRSKHGPELLSPAQAGLEGWRWHGGNREGKIQQGSSGSQLGGKQRFQGGSLTKWGTQNVRENVNAVEEKKNPARLEVHLSFNSWIC